MNNRNHTRRFSAFVCFLLAALLVFSGCSITKGPKSDIEKLQDWLEKDCSFNMSYQYNLFPFLGTSQNTVQTFGTDGSWSFINDRKDWNRRSDYEATEHAEHYYRYEDKVLVCYNRFNNDPPKRIEITKSMAAEMDKSMRYLVGIPAILPTYMEELSVAHSGDSTTFSFSLPVRKVLDDQTLLSSFVYKAFSLSGNEYKDEWNLKILCTVEAEGETVCPQTVTYDFSQLKPYIMTNGAQSAEYALDTDFMTMTYSFDYVLSSPIEIPAQLIP
ncbi:MAG: hypothetical protein E7453_09135 [Ruminococcaceae bacterium]|nr:hypothetical protein [Oscillospiraceae bacterium]